MISNKDFQHARDKKLNYLLVMPRLIQKKGDGYSFPLGIAYISACLKKAGFHVFTLNLNHCEEDISTIITQEIDKHHIDVVATGGLSFQYNMVQTVIEAAKNHNNEIMTIVGGGIISGDPEPAMEALEFADFGVIGEGEVTVVELCHELEGDKDYAKINGIIYRNGDDFQFTQPRREMDSLDDVPWPDYEGFGIGEYLENSPPGISGLDRKNTVFMLASRSCPYNCTFCFHTTGRRYRQRSLDDFFEELDYLHSKYNIDFINLSDELFARDVARVGEFCQRIKKYGIKWWAQFRVDDITPEFLAMLKDGGCEIMSFGLESADNRILKSMRKHTTIEQIEQTLELVYESGITLDGAFIFGDEAETQETAQNTLQWWKDHAEYKITLNLITVYPGSALYKHACEKGIIKDRVQFLKEGCPQINVSKLNDQEYAVVLREIMEAPLTLTKTPTDTSAEVLDYQTGRVTTSGNCSVCGKPNKWEDVKLFSSTYMACKHCRQRYNLVVPDNILEVIDDNVVELLSLYGKMGVWGVNYHTTNLFKRSQILGYENIYAIDISDVKKKMDLYGKKITGPEVISKENIRAILLPIPAYINEITARIHEDYPFVEEIVDICQLIMPNYFSQKIPQ